MREIKFRAWDEIGRNMIQINSLRTEYSNESDLRFAVDGVRFPIMQYTGLKDKNGKEIYEGDIIRDCNGLDCTWVVQWIDSEACYGGLDWCSNPNEVIGNIYENPELLK